MFVQLCSCKKATLKEILIALHKQDPHTLLNIPKKIIFEVTDTVEITEKLGIKVDRFNKVLDNIDKKKRHCELMQQPRVWVTRVIEQKDQKPILNIPPLCLQRD